MKLEQQVTSLELSKRLKELGVKQESLFTWLTYIVGNREPELLYGTLKKSRYLSNVQGYAAYTCSELGEILPKEALGAYLMAFKGTDEWSCAYGVQRTIHAPNECETRGLMLCYLIENKLMAV